MATSSRPRTSCRLRVWWRPGRCAPPPRQGTCRRRRWPTCGSHPDAARAPEGLENAGCCPSESSRQFPRFQETPGHVAAGGTKVPSAVGDPAAEIVISMDVMKICVTGSSGRAGRAVVADLTEHGHQVTGADLVQTRSDVAPAAFLRADLTDYGQAVEVLAGVGAVVLLGNIPAPWVGTPSETVKPNMGMNFTLFQGPSHSRDWPVGSAARETPLRLALCRPP